MIVQLRASGTAVDGSPRELARKRREFAAGNHLLLPDLIDPCLLDAIGRNVEREQFVERRHGRIGVELCLPPGPATGSLELLANDPVLFRVIEEVTGCVRIGCFDGRVYRMMPGADHYDSWHGDIGAGRLVALSVNLSPAPYAGGVLQIAEVATGRMTAEVANVRFGDGLLFRVADGLQHRVTAVEGPVPKTAYAGWFCSSPEYRPLFLRRLGR